MRVLPLNALGCGVRVRCADDAAHTLFDAAYGALRGGDAVADLEYTVSRAGASPGFRIDRPGHEPLLARDDGTLMALFDADIAVEVQRHRRDLYFIHAAVLEYRDSAVMLVAESGGGKSTLCWALLHHRFGFLSDELGPVDLATLDVHPYLRALMVKRDPPPPYPLAAGAVRTSRGAHVAVSAMPSEARDRPTGLAAIFFLRRSPERCAPSVRRIGGPEAAARLYVHALNPLAHDGDGVDGAIRIATARPCFDLLSAELAQTCALVTATLLQQRS